MAKQIKIGHDRVPAPITERYVPLYDVFSGTILRDISGNEIVTAEETILGTFIEAQNATPVVISNKNPGDVYQKFTRNGKTFIKKDDGQPLIGSDDLTIKVREVFATTTEVSNTLLGVPRSEQQLSLFSDVSTYGLDVDNWTHYQYSGALDYPSQWYRRKNKTYGRRGGMQFIEYTDEQALALRGFPVQYTYPFGPSHEGVGRYSATRFTQYKRFIAIGKELYSYFASKGYKTYADENFIPDYITFVNQDRNPISQSVVVNLTGEGIENLNAIYDIEYGDDIQLAFDQVEAWTQTYSKIRNQALNAPLTLPKNIVSYILQNATLIAPGYSTGANYYAMLESVDTFRYQPGRISGMTFGIRVKNDTTNVENVVEWGGANDTDQYMFQVRGGEFNIVRRSTIPFPESLLRRMGLDPDSQTGPKYADGIDQKYEMYETVIQRQFFNGDRLDGNGPSGYNLRFENVTMFKIEYSWYGAIGVNFYAYIPEGHEGARWVRIHTMVIENGLGQPILQNPEFKFRYFISVNNTGSVIEPMYVYKYGSSYYIDGGDEGTLRLTSSDSVVRDFDTLFDKGALGFMPKGFISNTDGTYLPNNLKAYPLELNASTDSSALITVREVVGSPDGMHFHYSPSLHNGVSSKSKQFRLAVNAGGNITLDYDPFDPTLTVQTVFGEEDKFRKIIADGVHNCYIVPSQSGLSTASVYRRQAYNLGISSFPDQIKFSNGDEIIDTEAFSFVAKCARFDEIVASSTPITSDKFTINWLNPVARDNEGYGHFADFFIGVTYHEPTTISITDPNDANNTIQVLRFGTDEIEYDTTDALESNDVAVWSHYNQNVSLDGFDTTEWDPTWGIRFDIDPRLPQPGGSDSGIISKLAGRVNTNTIDVIEVVDGAGTPGATHTIKLSSPIPNLKATDVGHVDFGVNGKSVGITLMSLPQQTQENALTIFVIDVYYDGDITSIPGWSSSIDYKAVTISDDYRISGYEYVNGELTDRFVNKRYSSSAIPVPFTNTKLYTVIGMNDNARINNIILEEIFSQTKITKTPQWVFDHNTSIDLVLSGNSTIDRSPANFIEKERLSAVLFDGSNDQPLRPGKDICQLLLVAGETRRFDLSNIFNYDRKKVSKGLYNNRAYYVTVKPIGDGNTGGDISLALTVKEQ